MKFKLDFSTTERPTVSQISAEWGSDWQGPPVIVEVLETSSTDLSQNAIAVNGTNIQEGPKIIVRAEEVLIVVLVLILWVAAIALFFNRWGKIRMLEPYQPKFQQAHRSSCPLVDIESLSPINHQRTSFSRMSMGMSLQIPSGHFGSISGPSGPSMYAVRANQLHIRPRQNSVFVGPQFYIQQAPRKTRSAMDLHSMVLDEAAEPV
ncbi:hypothetical protein Bhyg_11660 [Pseudolycoriella hygida]|uniref:Fibronectin type III domain-containing protein n=1 Tax=Pseudolycoriella hygida TaxID=35572 RepID=A0A9Q0MYE1_9DIPT|nr:hypothetical protein Bhyg_11660 [Pseudolycoriella hygida]